MTPLLWKLVAVLVLVGLAWAHGLTTGRKQVQGDWDAATVQAERQEQAKADEQRKQAQAEAEAFEAKRARLQSELTKTRSALSVALRTPISCGADNETMVGDVVVPADALASLRLAANPAKAD